MPDFKSLFETPKKARITIICLLVALATLGAVFYVVFFLWDAGVNAPPAQSEAVSAAPSVSPGPDASGLPAETPASTQAPVGLVPAMTIDEARELALADAGVDPSQAEVSREALSQDNGVWVYEFRFRTQEAQYEYKLNANTGELRGKVKEAFVYPSPEPAQPSMPSLPADSPPPAETDSQPVPTAAPGLAPTVSPDPGPSQSAAMYIGLERAKSIALEHAGLSGAQVRFTSARMDREDGIMVYEIEFRSGQVKYEYEIDASSGRILDHEQDAD